MINGEELFAWLYKVKTDKLLHVLFGLLIAQVVFVCLHFVCQKWLALLGAFLIASLVAGAKELIDIRYGVPSWNDWIASVIGATVGLIIMLLS